MQIFDLSKKFPVEERYSLRELHKKMICLQQRFAIQWYLARPCIISGQDARTTRNFGIFFKLEVSNRSKIKFVVLPGETHLINKDYLISIMIQEFALMSTY